MPKRLHSVLVILVLILASALSAQTRPGRAAEADRTTQAPARHETASATPDPLSQTSHVIKLDGRDIRYTATAGTLPIRLDNGAVAARMFFVAYTKDGENSQTRPVSFLYNGGPGSASVWLHMGSFAPKKARMAEEGFQPPPPYRLVDNEYSLIDVSDMVFVDAIDTGFSRVMPEVDNAQFHGQEGDIRAFGEFIAEYLKTFNRYPSPKFLIGESYGTIRSAGLSAELQSRHAIELNGIVLVSALLTYQTLSPAPDNDIAYAVQIQTFAATAWYHKKLPVDLLAKTVDQVVDEARIFAFGEYMTALTKGNALNDEEKKAMAGKLARFTGLSPAYILSANLRVDSGRFRKELLRDQRLVVGRLDGRFTALDADSAGERQEFDPSNVALAGPYVATFRDYLKNVLKWDTDLHYPTSGNVRPWTYVQNRYMDMTEALRSTMAKNPFLKVFVVCGYYDMATYVGGAEFNFTHLAYDRPVTDRVSFGYYEAGHMMYIRPSAQAKLKQDTAAFIRSALPGGK
ncbi:MAG: peptidase S10 [Candidatus Aminicenantes bacterium]|nr:peptidase S10 [Candidatus Aminicenantes bacterium]